MFNKKIFTSKSIKHIFICYFSVILFFISLISIAQADELIWQDEFDGTNLDTNNWTRQNLPGYDSGNNQCEYNTTREDNSYIDNGNLIIKAIDEDYGGYHFTSARLNTKNKLSFKYGLLEARIKVPNLADGLWPAFWMMGTSSVGWPGCGEIDIAEMGFASNIAAGVVNRRVSATAHWEYNDSHAQYGLSKDLLSNVYFYNDYHKFSVNWTPTYIQAYLDDVSYWIMDISDIAGSDVEEYHLPFYILLNLAVGGTPTGITDYNNITASFPALMYIDWVRLYDNGFTTDLTLPSTGTPSPTPTPTALPTIDPSLNLIINGDFGDNTAWTQLVIENGGISFNYNYSSNIPAAGSSPALRMSTTAANTNNGAIYQAINLEGGKTYMLNGAIKDTGGSQFWANIYLAANVPQASVDYDYNKIAAINAWSVNYPSNHNFDGLLSNAYDLASEPYTVPGTGTITYYLVIKGGAYAGKLEVTLDELILYDVDAIVTPSPTPMIINNWELY